MTGRKEGSTHRERPTCFCTSLHWTATESCCGLQHIISRTGDIPRCKLQEDIDVQDLKATTLLRFPMGNKPISQDPPWLVFWLTGDNPYCCIVGPVWQYTFESPTATPNQATGQPIRSDLSPGKVEAQTNKLADQPNLP